MERKMEMIDPQSQKVLELKKHVAVIHSSNKLSLLQRKIANALLFNAYPELQEREEHSIHIARLCEIIGYASHDHKSIKRALINLLSTVLEWNLVDGERLDNEGVWNASSIIADASIDGPICTYSYSNKMRKLLYRPNVYGRLDMLVQAKFQSGYGLALYENCNRFQDIGQTPWFNIAKFRQLMGVEENKYKIFRDFKTRVLDKAVQEVNKYSSLIISLQLRKQRRQVTAIQFLIKKSQTAVSYRQDVDEIREDSLPDILKLRFGFSAKQIHHAMLDYEDSYIRDKITLVQSSASFMSGKVKNVARYLLSALRDDYQPTKTSQSVTKSIPKPLDKYELENRSREEQLKMSQFMRYQDKQLLILYAQLGEEEKATLMKHFDKFLGSAIYKDIFVRNGLENVLIQDQLCAFLRQINHKLIEYLPSKDTWLIEAANVSPAIYPKKRKNRSS